MNFHIAACSDKGIVRANNQDRFWVKAYQTEHGEAVLAVLCDGVGGLDKGEIASGTVVYAFAEWADRRVPELLDQDKTDAEDIYNEWDEVIAYQNDILVIFGNQCEVKLGTTATVLLLIQDRYYIAQVGDSRAYVITDVLCQLTTDHSLVAREVALGNMTKEEAKKDRRRNVLLQCVGATDEVDPDYYTGEIFPGAVFLLCSDGFYHEIEDEEFISCFSPSIFEANMGMLQDNLEYLIELNKQRNERDNITAIAVLTY